MHSASRRLIGLWLGGLVFFGNGLLGQPSELQGAWKQVEGEALLHVKGDQVLMLEKGRLSIRGIVRHQPEALILRNSGILETWSTSLRDGVLRLGHAGEERAFRRLPSVPADVEFRPLTITSTHSLSPERVQAIQQELASRFEREQKERGKEEVRSILAENADYLVKLVQEVGWIDTARFGKQASVHATIMLKHTSNLPFMVAVLPSVERDLKSTGDGQTYAVLYDAVQLDLGRKQRYGTQIGMAANGDPYILPLENPDRVDEYLKEIGLPPLSQYRADASKFLFHGRPIRLATPEESQ